MRNFTLLVSGNFVFYFFKALHSTWPWLFEVQKHLFLSFYYNLILLKVIQAHLQVKL